MPRRRGTARELVVPALGALAVGVVGALAWWLVVPSPPARQLDGFIAAPGAPELYATQDGVFAAIAVVLGLVTGVLLLRRPGPRPTLRVVVTVVSCALASLLMWQVGGMLSGGEPGLGAAGTSAAVGAEVSAPLTVHATGVLALWPATAVTLLLLGYLWADLGGTPPRVSE